MTWDLKRANKFLADHYGKDIDGRPKYRISFTGDQTITEVREGPFQIFQGPIFIRTVKEPMEVPKYPFTFQKDRWVMERLTFVGDVEYKLPVRPSNMLKLDPFANGSYEPIYFFKKLEKPIIPSRKALEFMMDAQLNRRVKTESDYVEEAAKDDAAERAETFAFLDDQDSEFSSAKRAGELIIRP